MQREICVVTLFMRNCYIFIHIRLGIQSHLQKQCTDLNTGLFLRVTAVMNT